MTQPGIQGGMRALVSGLVMLCCVAACSSSKTRPVVSPVDDFEQSALNAMDLQLDDAALGSLQSALLRYQAIDNLYGQWRAHWLMARLYLTQDDSASATVQIDAMAQLAAQLNDPTVYYQTYLLLGQSRDQAFYQKALDVSASPLQNAIVHTYMGQYQQAMDEIDRGATDYPADRAFVYFRYAVARDSVADMQQALDLYKRAADSRGIADSLLWLARNSLQGGDVAVARTYAERAQRVLAASGDEVRAGYVANWLEQIP